MFLATYLFVCCLHNSSISALVNGSPTANFYIHRGLNQSEMREFAAFVEDMELIDVPTLGKKFSFFGSVGKSMSRIDRILMSEDRWQGYIRSHLDLIIVGWSTKTSSSLHRIIGNLSKWKGGVIMRLKRSWECRKKNWDRGIEKYLDSKDLQIDNIVKELNEVERLAPEGGPLKIEQKKFLNADFWKELHARESLLISSKINN